MNDSIPSIRFVPQISKLNPKGRAGDQKDHKESKKDFLKHLSTKDKGVEDKGHNQVKKDNKYTEHKKQNDENSLQEKTDHDIDNGCGTILDTEI